jgi:hypothetical protein
MGADVLLRRIHRLIAALFLLTIPPAAYFSFTGDPSAPSPVVYLPLIPLFGLTITGSYLLVKPWVNGSRHDARRRESQGPTQQLGASWELTLGRHRHSNPGGCA